MVIDTALLFSRKHPFYERNERRWRRQLAAYSGGEDYIKLALIKHMSEIPPEFTERLHRACYLNYPRKIARIITQYVLAKRPERENADSEFIEDFDRSGLRVDEVMRQFCTYLNICGSAWLVVDMPRFDGPKTKADELTERLRPYCIALSPLAVTDWCYGDDGKLLWALIVEDKLNNLNPFEQPQRVRMCKLWTRNEITVITQNDATGDMTTEALPNTLGVVPVIRHVEVDGYGIGENHWFEDVVRISDAILNNESEAQMNVVKQMFGLLVVPEDFLDTAKQQFDEHNNAENAPKEPLSHILARSAAIYESVEGKGVSRYISPSGAETATIQNANIALKKELYEIVGLAVSQDTKLVASAEAKAWDFQNIEQYMATRADMLEQCEVKAWELLNLWMPTVPVPTVSYNRNFSIIDLKESVATLLELSTFCPDNDDYQREIGKTAVALLNRLRQLSPDQQTAIINTIMASTPGSDNAAAKVMLEALQQGRNDGNNDDGNFDNSGKAK